MASFDSALGMWKSKNGQYYSSQSEALDAERNYIDDGDWMGTTGIDAKAPDVAADPGDTPNPNNPGGISDNELAQRRAEISASGTTTANINADRVDYNRPATFEQTLAARPVSNDWLAPTQERSGGTGSYILDSNGNRVYIRGDIYKGESADIESKMGTVTSQGTIGGVEGLSFEPPAAPPPGGAGGNGGADQQTQRAENTFRDEDTENQNENQQAWSRAWGAIDDIKGGDYGLSDEARGYQREGLQQQRMLLQKMLGFDEDKFASRYADRALAGTIAAGRSAGGGYAGQQAGMMAAMDKAPELYAEGQRQASTLTNQRLGMAENAAKAFGDLGTMTRGQDEQRAQFESDLTVTIADQVSKLSQGQVQLNQQESQMFAEMWMDFAKLQSVYAGMDSDEMIAWWQTEAAKRGQDKQLEGILANIRANGAVSSKDMIGGLFQLGGGLVSTIGTMAAA